MVENTVESKEEISFTMNAEKLSNIFGYLKDINNEIPMIFLEDRIAIRQKSVDNVQYTEIEIGEKDITKYNPGLKHENKSRNILVDISKVALDEINSMCSIATRETMDDMDRDTVRKQHNVDVKIRSNKKIEFHCPGNVIVWARLLENEQYTKGIFEHINKMPEIIKKVRNNPDIKKSSVTMDSRMCNELCNIERQYYNDDYCVRTFTVKIDKKEGLVLVSKTTDGFYELILRPKCLSIECEEGNKDTVNIDKHYIDPFGRLSSDSLVTIEVRKDKPIVLERKLGEHTTAMLTVAPRIEVETTKEMDKKIIEDFMAF